MPVEHISFYLKPSGFFDASPARDVPPGNGSRNYAHSTGIIIDNDQLPNSVNKGINCCSNGIVNKN